jgi:menaquinol-cytochrome c reductase iron-sulfur subunit
VRDLMRPRKAVPPAAPAVAAAPLDSSRFPRSKFLEASTLGLGAVIGGMVTLPAVALAILPPFLKQGRGEVDLGPLDDYPEGKWVLARFMLNPEHGEVSERTAFVRYNGTVDVQGRGSQPSFTIISNRCAHLGCPVQPNGPLEEKTKDIQTGRGLSVRLQQAVAIAGFGCPCHGGAYDTEGNRTAGPPVRSLDRYEFSIRRGRLFLGKAYSVSHVEKTGADAKIGRHKLSSPGVHVDGWESILYPFPQPPSA